MRQARLRAALALVLPLALTLFEAGCKDEVLPGPNLERMLVQERYAPYEPSRYFDDGKVMRRPPEGTIPRERTPALAGLSRGVAEGAYLTQIPLEISRHLLELGRARFEIHCAVCHGIRGDGRSVVAEKMILRKPPSLVSDKVRAFPPGRIFEVASEGYGLMPSYAHALDVEERWAIVAYLSALQRSHKTRLEALPESMRQEAQKELE